jgi:hypothetical protein
MLAATIISGLILSFLGHRILTRILLPEFRNELGEHAGDYGSDPRCAALENLIGNDVEHIRPHTGTEA